MASGSDSNSPRALRFAKINANRSNSSKRTPKLKPFKPKFSDTVSDITIF